MHCNYGITWGDIATKNIYQILLQLTPNSMFVNGLK
jgi:hypothetical protein